MFSFLFSYDFLYAKYYWKIYKIYRVFPQSFSLSIDMFGFIFRWWENSISDCLSKQAQVTRTSNAGNNSNNSNNGNNNNTAHCC